MKDLQKKQAWIVTLCASVTLFSCHLTNKMAENEKAKSGTHTLSKSQPPARAKVSRSKTSTRSKGGQSIAKFDPRKNATDSSTNMLNTNTSPKANYNIATIGRAQDPSTIYNWNWATDFGGTVDMVTISF